MRDAGRLAHDSVVSTVMSNLGFRQAMQREGVAVVATAVGDRYVLEAMRSFGYTLGGEQSGHLIMSEHATTGDGLLTALHLAAEVAASGEPLADLASVMQRFPQVLVNVSDVDQLRVDAPAIAAAVAEEERELGEHGPRAAASQWHRAARAGDGRGRHGRAGPAGGRPAGCRRARDHRLTWRALTGAAARAERRV